MSTQCEVNATPPAGAPISLFRLESGAALATVVGVLIEVPVMLLLVNVVNAGKGWYEAKA